MFMLFLFHLSYFERNSYRTHAGGGARRFTNKRFGREGNDRESRGNCSRIRGSLHQAPGNFRPPVPRAEPAHSIPMFKTAVSMGARGRNFPVAACSFIDAKNTAKQQKGEVYPKNARRAARRGPEEKNPT